MSHQRKRNLLRHTWMPNFAGRAAGVSTFRSPRGQAHSPLQSFSRLPELLGGACPKNAMTTGHHNVVRISLPNPAHSLDAGLRIRLVQASLPRASDARRWAAIQRTQETSECQRH